MTIRTKRPVSMASAAAALAALLFALAASAAAAPKVGAPAPLFTAVDSNGVKRSLADYRGKTVVLEWTNHECPFVMKHYGAGNMQALQKEAAANDVIWLSVISSAPGKQGHVGGAAANALTKRRGASPAAVLLDPEGALGRLYDARTTPHIYVIDDAGALRYMGAIDDKPTANPADIAGAKSYVTIALAAARKGETANPAATQPYGCTVKYP